MDEENKEIDSKKSVRCSFSKCNKKLNIFESLLKCSCGLIFCNKHRFYTQHNCQYDYKIVDLDDREKKKRKIVFHEEFTDSNVC